MEVNNETFTDFSLASFYSLSNRLWKLDRPRGVNLTNRWI